MVRSLREAVFDYRHSSLRISTAARVDLTAPTRAHISELPQSDDDTALQDGDLILQMDGEIMTSLQDVHRRLAFFAGASRSDLVWDVLVVRDGVERWCFIPVTNLPVLDTRQQYERHAAAAGFAHKLPGIAAGLLLGWCGGILLFPGRAVLEQVDPQAHPDVDFSALPYLSTVMLYVVGVRSDVWNVAIIKCFQQFYTNTRTPS